jgi:hypothetical protein
MELKRYSCRGFSMVSVTLFLCLVLAAVAVDNALAEMKLTKTVDGLKATLSVTPKMADLLLVDAGSGRAVTDGVVTATVVYPNGKKSVKKLMGMKMGDVYSYMNSIDISAKGIYTFHITVKVAKRTVKFDFKSGVR